jgi:hypothetical protein
MAHIQFLPAGIAAWPRPDLSTNHKTIRRPAAPRRALCILEVSPVREWMLLPMPALPTMAVLRAAHSEENCDGR